MDKRYKTSGNNILKKLGVKNRDVNDAITLDLIYDNIDNKNLMSSIVKDGKIYIFEHSKEGLLSKKMNLRSVLVIDVKNAKACFYSSNDMINDGVICNGEGIYEFIINYYKPEEIVLGKSLCFSNEEAKMISKSPLRFIDQENIWCVDRLRRLSNVYLNHLFLTVYLVENYNDELKNLSDKQVFLIQNLMIYRPGDTAEEIDKIIKK